jgi:hypothetical protein
MTKNTASDVWEKGQIWKKLGGYSNEGKSAARFGHQVSISPIFYEQLFHMKVFCTYYLGLYFLEKGFWCKSCS